MFVCVYVKEKGCSAQLFLHTYEHEEKVIYSVYVYFISNYYSL